MLRKLFFGFFCFLFAVPAQAAWYEASSDHFIIYANQKENDVREFAERLERYHDTMRFLFNRPADKPSPSNRVTVYVVANSSDVRELSGSDNKFLQGFYIPRAGGTLAIIPKVKTKRYETSQSELILLHEYAHHFLIGSSTRAFPKWLSEGFAEFYGTAKFGTDGSVGVGLAANHRAYELAAARDVPIELLLDTAAYNTNKSKRYDSFYGKSWALYHMLHFSDERKGQMTAYTNLLGQGKGEIEAAREAFGDLDALEKDLDAYLRQRKITAYNISPKYLKTGEIKLRTLSAGEAEAMSVRIQSKRGVNTEEALALLPEARALAAKYPGDPAVLTVLAEAEFDAGNNDEAIIAADRATSLNPNLINAHIQKIYALARKAEDTKDPDTAWNEVRKQVVVVNRIENDNPIPLIQYYRSYREQGIKVPQIAVDGLYRALELAPYDQGVRWMMANQFMEDKDYQMAAFTLGPLANNPHQSTLSDKAAELLKEAQAKQAAAGKTSDKGNQAAASITAK